MDAELATKVYASATSGSVELDAKKKCALLAAAITVPVLKAVACATKGLLALDAAKKIAQRTTIAVDQRTASA